MAEYTLLPCSRGEENQLFIDPGGHSLTQTGTSGKIRLIYEYMLRCSVMRMNLNTITIHQLEEGQAAQVAELFSALGDPNRVRIIAALTGGEMHVSALAETVGISESAISHHMRHLRQLRLVRTRKDGRYVFYALDDTHVADLFRCGLEHVQHG